MNKESLSKTIGTCEAHYWSTSRNTQWLKGEISGTQEVKEIYVDCDMDAVILKVKQKGAACHLGYYSCFFRKLNLENKPNIENIEENDLTKISERVFNPEKVYSERL